MLGKDVYSYKCDIGILSVVGVCSPGSASDSWHIPAAVAAVNCG